MEYEYIISATVRLCLKGKIFPLAIINHVNLILLWERNSQSLVHPKQPLSVNAQKLHIAGCVT